MTDPKLQVLIGDDDVERTEWLSKFLGDYCNVTPRVFGTFDSLLGKAGAASDACVVFLADTLPFSYLDPQFTPGPNFSQLQVINRRARFVCIVTGDKYPDLSQVHAEIRSIRMPAGKRGNYDEDRIVDELKRIKELRLAEVTVEQVAAITGVPKDDRALNDLIQSLSPNNELAAGKRILFLAIRNSIDCAGVEKIDVEALTQGMSGARVFGLKVSRRAARSPGAESKSEEYVLKLSKTEDLWKLQAEVDGYIAAKNSGDMHSIYDSHIPRLFKAHSPSSEVEPASDGIQYIASTLSWNAIHYDFLGRLGECIALATALVAAPKRIEDLTAGASAWKGALTLSKSGSLTSFRMDFLDSVLKSLCRIWYLNSPFTDRERLWLWRNSHVPQPADPRLPPYQLAERTRKWIHQFLDSSDAEIGPRLFPDWERCRYAVVDLLGDESGPRLPGFLNREIPVTLSPVHGDLNTSNVFLWLKRENFPFLIDLPFHEPLGHIMQDFACLEMEIKFSLMDRQEESPADRLPAYDHSPTQVPLWIELEDRLLNRGGDKGAAAATDWRAPGFPDNVRLTYDLVGIIRRTAEEAQQQRCAKSGYPPEAFLNEYLPALLYHTVRAISYPSLTVFKRLLAVYSAGSILKLMGD